MYSVHIICIYVMRVCIGACVCVCVCVHVHVCIRVCVCVWLFEDAPVRRCGLASGLAH